MPSAQRRVPFVFRFSRYGYRRVERLRIEQSDSSAGTANVAESANDVIRFLIHGTDDVGGEQDDGGGEGAVGLDSVTVDGELVGGECIRLSDGQGNGGAIDQKDEKVVETCTVCEPEACAEDKNFGDDEYIDGNET